MATKSKPLLGWKQYDKQIVSHEKVDGIGSFYNCK